MPTIYQGYDGHPYHFSVGAILRRADGAVCFHHFVKGDLGLVGYWIEEGVDDMFLLMRETLEPGEGLEEAVHRGLMEEFGATGKIVDYIGSFVGHFRHKGVLVEKTTPYFIVDMETQDSAKRTGKGIEVHTRVEWHDPVTMIPLMK
jgi:hypothetical protein